MKLRLLGVIAVILALIVTLACRADPQGRARSTNPGVSVSVLTSFDGITVYRVQDGSAKTVYVAVRGSNLTAQWNETCGKNCTTTVQTLTLDK